MKVSIITSCFNREETIGQAIESVLAQKSQQGPNQPDYLGTDKMIRN